MFPDELEAAFAACPVVYFAYGLCEPHGPQNAVGLDALKAHAIACAAARAHGGIVAPPNYWHIHELGLYAGWAAKAVGEVERSWMTAVPPWHHFRQVLYEVRAADRLGFHAAIFLTGHYGPNWQDLKTVLELAQHRVGTRLYGLPDFEANQPGFAGDGKSTGDHAGRVETSLLWTLEPECVDLSRLPAEGVPGPHFAMGRDAGEANRRTGERMVADEVRWLGEKARELLAEYDRLKPEHRLKTFGDVEALWRELIRPEVPRFKSMEEARDDRDEPPADSKWYPGWRVPEWD
jgi:creatinine amidohydrolase